MKTSLNAKAENIKNTIKGTSEKSRDAIKEIIHNNSKHLDDALNANKKVLDALGERFHMPASENELSDKLKKTFRKSVELSEDTIDSIINAYNKQMDLYVDFNTRLVDAIKESSMDGNERALELIMENFEKTRQLNIENTKEIVEAYNKHTNLALNFSKKFEDNIHYQMENFTRYRDNHLKAFNVWTTEWWKEGREKETVQ